MGVSEVGGGEEEEEEEKELQLLYQFKVLLSRINIPE